MKLKAKETGVQTRIYNNIKRHNEYLVKVCIAKILIIISRKTKIKPLNTHRHRIRKEKDTLKKEQ